MYGVTNEWLVARLSELDSEVYEVVGPAESMYPCPCCGYDTVRSRGQYDICVVCYWEDDGATSGDEYSAVNHMTLSEARKNFSCIGASSRGVLKHIDQSVRDRYSRSTDPSD